ncbi:MAG: hypothetical protein ACTS4W_01225 [Candidatus Hodgkinia cicadicola]
MLTKVPRTTSVRFDSRSKPSSRYFHQFNIETSAELTLRRTWCLRYNIWHSPPLGAPSNAGSPCSASASIIGAQSS